MVRRISIGGSLLRMGYKSKVKSGLSWILFLFFSTHISVLLARFSHLEPTTLHLPSIAPYHTRSDKSYYSFHHTFFSKSHSRVSTPPITPSTCLQHRHFSLNHHPLILLVSLENLASIHLYLEHLLTAVLPFRRLSLGRAPIHRQCHL